MGVSGCDLLFECNWKNIGRACFLIVMISQLSDFGLSVAEHISDEELYGKHKELLQVNSGHHSPHYKTVYKSPWQTLHEKWHTSVLCGTVSGETWTDVHSAQIGNWQETKVRTPTKSTLVNRRSSLQAYGRGLLGKSRDDSKGAITPKAPPTNMATACDSWNLGAHCGTFRQPNRSECLFRQPAWCESPQQSLLLP